MTSITGNGYIDSLIGTTDTSGVAKAKSNSTLDQSAFLKLMTTQLQTQDPTAPVDNTQMVAQMAQFSQVAGVAEMNASLKTIMASLQSQRLGDTATWIGKSALVPSKDFVPQSDGSYVGQITLDQDVSALSVKLTDEAGQTVYAADYGAQKKGAQDFGWDGKAGDSALAATGKLTMTVTAKAADGSAVTPVVTSWAQVTGVQSPAGGTAARLVTALGLIDPATATRLS